MTLAAIAYAVMCGGAGSRLWPLSTLQTPKPFLDVLGRQSPFQSTLARIREYPGPVATIIIGGENHGRLISEQSDTDAVAEIILEPFPRDTAPVALVAAIRTQALFGDGRLVLLAPADHMIKDVAAFQEAIARAAPAAEAGHVVTFGVRPAGPETGYGYVEVAEDWADCPGIVRARGFREKPDAATARAYFASGRHLWNAGMFLFRPSTILTSAERIAPDMLAASREACADGKLDGRSLHLGVAAYRRIDPISFDYAFAERMTGQVVVAPVEMGWSDIGSWRAVHAARARAATDNVIEGPVELEDSIGALVLSYGPAVFARGMINAAIVATCDEVLVAPLASTDGLKDVLAALEVAGKTDDRRECRAVRSSVKRRFVDLSGGTSIGEYVVEPDGEAAVPEGAGTGGCWSVVVGDDRRPGFSGLVNRGPKPIRLVVLYPDRPRFDR